MQTKKIKKPKKKSKNKKVQSIDPRANQLTCIVSVLCEALSGCEGRVDP